MGTAFPPTKGAYPMDQAVSVKCHIIITLSEVGCTAVGLHFATCVVHSMVQVSPFLRTHTIAFLIVSADAAHHLLLVRYS